MNSTISILQIIFFIVVISLAIATFVIFTIVAKRFIRALNIYIKKNEK